MNNLARYPNTYFSKSISYKVEGLQIFFSSINSDFLDNITVANFNGLLPFGKEG
jgi:hypothetical protein